MSETYTMVDPQSLEIQSPFSDLFPISPSVREKIVESMAQHGYDASKPINVWRPHNIVVDGHTRREAAIACGVAVPVFYHDFLNEDEALQYAIANQRDRRNLADADLLRLIEVVDTRRKHGGARRGEDFKASCEALKNHNKTATATAEIVGTSRAKVERARTILDVAKTNPEIKEEVLSGKIKINKGSKIAREAKKKGATPAPVIPVIPQPSAEPRKAVNESSTIHITNEQAEWLDSLPLRSKVVAHRFDEDAILYRHFEPILKQIKPDLLSVVGHRSDSGMSLLYRALLKLSQISSISMWTVCTKCNGSGIDKGVCGTCRGGGYQIPGI